MNSPEYLALKKKENKTPTEWELLKAVSTLRLISECVTDASKHVDYSENYINRIREHLNDNDY